jgi:hypothetical protein
MNFYKWLTVFGALLLVCGLLTAFISTHYTERVMSEEQRGVAVRVPDPNNPDEDKTKSFISWTDLSFYIGLVLAATGGILLAFLLPLSGRLPSKMRKVLGKSDRHKGRM